jgi:uncharacterized protein YjbI with pentapeptide repeats
MLSQSSTPQRQGRKELIKGRSPQLWWLGLLTLLGGTMISSTALAANPQHVKRLLKTNQCPLCDLSNADLSDTNLFGVSLVGANLEGANLSGSNLGAANLSDANLTSANLQGTYLMEATLDRTNLNQSNLIQAYLRNAKITHSQFEQAVLLKANLSEATIFDTNFHKADLSDANLSQTVFSEFQPWSGSVTSGGWTSYALLLNYRDQPAFLRFMCYLMMEENAFSPDETAQFQNSFVVSNLSQANLSRANLSDAILLGADLNQADLTQANLTNSCLGFAQLNQARLDGAELQYAQLFQTNLAGTNLELAKNVDPRFIGKTPTTVLESEAISILGTFARAQQAHHLEIGKFAQTEEQLAIRYSAQNFEYQILPLPPADQLDTVMIWAKPLKPNLKPYVIFAEQPKEDEYAYRYQLCRGVAPSTTVPQYPKLTQSSRSLPCPEGFVTIEE